MKLTDKFRDMAEKLCKENKLEGKDSIEAVFEAIKKQYYKCSEEDKLKIRDEINDWGKDLPST